MVANVFKGEESRTVLMLENIVCFGILVGYSAKGSLCSLGMSRRLCSAEGQ